VRQRLGNAGGLTDFGVNLMRLPPGNWSSQRHWHSAEDEFVYVFEGELTLIEDGGETVLRAGDCAAFPKGSGNGHHLINSRAPVLSASRRLPPLPLAMTASGNGSCSLTPSLRLSSRSVFHMEITRAIESHLPALRWQTSHALQGEPQPWWPQECVAGVFSLRPTWQGRYCPAAQCSGRPIIRPMAEQKKRCAAGRSTQFEPAACREPIEPLPGAETAHDRAESARCDRFLQRPEQIFLPCGSDHQHSLRFEAETGEPMPVKFAVLLRVPSRSTKARTFAALARCPRRKGQGKGERYSLIARRGAVQFMKARDKQPPRIALRYPRDHIRLGRVRAGIESLVRRHDRFVLFLFLQRERHFCLLSS
jgi:hypothetical protein